MDINELREEILEAMLGVFNTEPCRPPGIAVYYYLDSSIGLLRMYWTKQGWEGEWMNFHTWLPEKAMLLLSEEVRMTIVWSRED